MSLIQDVYLCPDVTGVQGSGLLISTTGTFTRLSRRPPGTWFLRSALRPNDDSPNVNTALRLEARDCIAVPSPKFSSTLTGMPQGTSPPWPMLMPRREYLSYINSVIDCVRSSLNLSDNSYYLNAWSQVTHLFTSMQRLVAPNPVMFDDQSCHEAASFRPRGGKCDTISYNRFGTRTGRLTTSSGPQILTLRKDHRKFLRSRWGDNGLLLSLDFSALEVRLLMSDMAGIVVQQDPYLDLSGALMGELNREKSKLALISTVYGSTTHGLSQSLGVSLTEAKHIHSTIAERCGVGDLLKRLRSEHNKNGFIRNRYGRRIETPDPGDGQLLNSYLQSTGVDVALLGFSEIIRRLNSDHAVPVALLHDALILDTTQEFADKISVSLSIPVPGFIGKFPIKVSAFNT